MTEKFREHLIRDQRPFLHTVSLQVLLIHSSMTSRFFIPDDFLGPRLPTFLQTVQARCDPSITSQGYNVFFFFFTLLWSILPPFFSFLHLRCLFAHLHMLRLPRARQNSLQLLTFFCSSQIVSSSSVLTSSAGELKPLLSVSIMIMACLVLDVGPCLK